MPDYTTLHFEVTEGVATITLNRPDAANGIDMQMAKELMDVAIRCSDDLEIRAVVLTGSGKMFSAGGDLKSFASYGEKLPSAIRELTLYLHGAVSRFMRMDAPLVVAVNGMAAGAGFSLAMAGDIVIAAESAKFTMAYTAAGLSPDGSASFLLPRLVGLRRTQELMLTNRRLSANEALEWGAVTAVSADSELMDTAQKQAQCLSRGPTAAYGQVKKLLLTSGHEGLESQMELEAQGISALSGTADGQEGISAFLEKRSPDFSGNA